ncbi:MAG: hypothetical protein KZQ92_10110 [Candidatus Thiodiazotropha sp. (ex Lucinoma borealis)]|nr:hypothetical protein [Candidatus Thiodiazotropha sp. (ex Lucinoma borealis)]
MGLNAQPVISARVENCSAAQCGLLGTVDISAYDNWLNHNRGVDVLH